MNGTDAIMKTRTTPRVVKGLALRTSACGPDAELRQRLPWLVAIVAFAYISSIGSSIYRCALYLYADTGVVPAPYDRASLDMAWKLETRSTSDV
jgi:hypothetical protein